MNLSIRLILDKVFFLLISALSLCLMIPLFMILFYIVKNGLPALSWEFLTHNPKPIGETGGGIANAIVGSFMIISIACFIAVPLGLFA